MLHDDKSRERNRERLRRFIQRAPVKMPDPNWKPGKKIRRKASATHPEDAFTPQGLDECLEEIDG